MYSYDVLPYIKSCMDGIGITGKKSYRAYDSLRLINRAAQRPPVQGKISYRPSTAASVALTIFCHTQHSVGQLLQSEAKHRISLMMFRLAAIIRIQDTIQCNSLFVQYFVFGPYSGNYTIR